MTKFSANSLVASIDLRYNSLLAEIREFFTDYINYFGSECVDYDGKFITVSIGNYTKLAFLNENLMFLDASGYQYNFDDVSLSKIIEAMNELIS